MEFQPKTEAEVAAAQLAPVGEYDFEVLDATDEVSAAGNAMIKVNLGIFESGGAMRWRIFDYLLPKLEAKLRHFCDTIGLLDRYQRGQLQAEDCKGRAGKCKIVIKEDKTGAYPPKNVVRDYVCRKAKPLPTAPAKPAAPPPQVEEDESDVPF